ncbi:hypothetical protein [uncultured Vagococcus sp.]|uniref:hypothetical protein n=1 Tax=uncultured Vagococcus sp. TaxID=189676 RepID=UPI0028D62BF6|nr:hypothetical protein [uncultured Vagococcus sp.]
MKKKLGILIAMIGTVVTLAACSTTPQGQFLEQMEKVSSTKNNSGTLEMSIADLELTQESAGGNDAMMGMIMSSVKGMKLTADYQTDSKTPENFMVNMKLSAMGTDIPMEMIGSMGDKPQIFISTDVMSSVMELAQTFGGANVPVITGLDDLKGKYVDVMAMQEATKASKADVKEMENAQEFAKAYQKEVAAYLKGLDKKSFTKKDDVITHTFTKKEISDIMALSQKVAKSDKKFASYVAEEVDFDEVLKELDDLSVTVKANTKTNATKIRTLVSPSEKNSSAGLKSITVDMVMTSKSDKVTVKLPAKEDILSKEQVNNLMTPEPTAQLSDEDFKTILDSYKGTASELSESEKAEMLKQSKQFLSDSQYKELEAVLK